jgi:DNA polymerase II large subunit
MRQRVKRNIEKYHFVVSNRSVGLEDLDTEVEINSAQERKRV